MQVGSGFMVQGFRRFDLFQKFDRKFEVDARQRTILGGLFSVISLIIISVLIVSETRYFLSSRTTQDMLVDSTVGGDMPISLNLTFHRIPCDFLVINSIDALGVHMDHITAKAVKRRVEPDTTRPIGEAARIPNDAAFQNPSREVGNPKCPSCHGAELYEGHCCFTCDDVRNAYEQRRWRFDVKNPTFVQCVAERMRLAAALLAKEGCNIRVELSVARVPGVLQFIPGELHTTFLGLPRIDLGDEGFQTLNLSHAIHHLEFGESFPGQINPLTGIEQIRGRETDTGAKRFVNGRFSYFVKVVPTRYEATSLLFSTSTITDSSQYSVTHHFTPSLNSKVTQKEGDSAKPEAAGRVIPGVFISYDLSPIKVHIMRSHPYPSFVHFLLQLCAVCGGVFTVAGLIDAMLYHSVRKLKKQREGKLM
ncbi:unnamed protein product [Phytomonas sp. EM1]|nr:unnamed protein product [Phytomonas sp. EM1]|eukprot:CCW65535.1 unnamed protein product [Phytomonas sp. isolate EM1]